MVVVISEPPPTLQVIGGLYYVVVWYVCLLFTVYSQWSCLWRSHYSQWGDSGPATHYHSELSDSLPVSAARVCSITAKLSVCRQWNVEPRPYPSGMCDINRYVIVTTQL